MFLKVKELIQIFCQIPVWVSNSAYQKFSFRLRLLVMQRTGPFQAAMHCCGML